MLTGIVAVLLFFVPLVAGGVAALSALQSTGAGVPDFAGGNTAVVCASISLGVMFVRTGQFLQPTGWIAVAILLAGFFAIWQSNKIRLRNDTESNSDR